MGILEQYKHLQTYFNKSPKRKKLLEFLVNKSYLSDNKRNIFLGMCKTTWSELDISYKRFYLAMPHTMEALEIMNGTHSDMVLFPDTSAKGWSSKDIRKHLHISIHYATFSIYLVLNHYTGSFHPTDEINTKLQGHIVDVMKTFNDV